MLKGKMSSITSRLFFLVSFLNIAFGTMSRHLCKTEYTIVTHFAFPLFSRGTSYFLAGCSLYCKHFLPPIPNCRHHFPFWDIFSHEPNIPPGAELSLEVKLLEATDAPDLELLPPVERIALASLKRERGNVHYQRGDYAFAVNSYSIALQITESNSKGRICFLRTMTKNHYKMCGDGLN